MNPDITTKLAELGYCTRYGRDDQLHIIANFRRGARALCGTTASKRDYRGNKLSCAVCMKICMAEVKEKGKMNIQIADTEHITELREASDESQTARLEVITEIARLTKSLRAAEAERNTATTELVTVRLALMNAEACRAEAEKQMHAAEAERNEMRNARDRAEKARADDYRQQTETVRALLEQRDATRTDAERLAAAIAAFIHSRRSDTGLLGYERIILELESALAAHKAATGKAVTP